MNTYGQLSNAELLHKYGFTELDNPNDEVSSNTHALSVSALSVIAPPMCRP